MQLLVTSAGLWRQRRDLARLLDARILPPGTPARLADAVAGWGHRPSGRRAARLAARHGLPLAVLEDGFLHGFAPNDDVPRASFTIDGRAPHYAPGGTLHDTITGDMAPADLERARSAMNELRHRRLSKYNTGVDLGLTDLGISSPFVVLIEQVEGDLSLQGAPTDVFARMVERARTDHPDHALVVRAHPAARGRGPLARLLPDATLPDAVVPDAIVPPPCNIWPLLEGATRVYTVSSHAGFEALMAGTPVSTFGRPFYAGWGLTRDAAVPLEAERPLAHLFAAAYLVHSRYLDIHTREPTTLEATIEDLAALRDTRLRNRRYVATGGLSPWKRRAVTPFLRSAGGPPHHFRSREAAERAAARHGGDLVVWGAEPPAATLPGLRTVRMEDGFLRSVGLGAALAFPLSLVRETRLHLYFDARGASSIEAVLRDAPPGPAPRARAARLIEAIRAARVTKYNAPRPARPLPETDRTKVLVVGQVEDDASIRLGALGVRTNSELLAAVRALFPDATIAYRDHPDVAAGLRSGRAERSHVDLDVDDHDILDLFAWCDRVETMTSLAGFEALLRGVAVGTHGWPFYAGWGLTDDRLDRPPRGHASLDALAAVALIRHPDYIHPISRLPCTPERTVAALSNLRLHAPGNVWHEALGRAGWAVGRLKHLRARRRPPEPPANRPFGTTEDD